MQTHELIAAILGGTGLGGGLYHLITLKLRKRKLTSETIRQEFTTADEIVQVYLERMNKMVETIDKLQDELILVKTQLKHALLEIEQLKSKNK